MRCEVESESGCEDEHEILTRTSQWLGPPAFRCWFVFVLFLLCAPEAFVFLKWILLFGNAWPIFFNSEKPLFETSTRAWVCRKNWALGDWKGNLRIDFILCFGNCLLELFLFLGERQDRIIFLEYFRSIRCQRVFFRLSLKSW